MDVLYSSILGSFLTLGIYLSRNDFNEYNELPQERKIALSKHPRNSEIENYLEPISVKKLFDVKRRN